MIGLIKYHKTEAIGYFNEKEGDNSSPFCRLQKFLNDHIHIMLLNMIKNA